MAKPPILEVTNLCIHRGETRILDAVDWRVNSGQHWIILGANGSGKTSLLSALAGYLSPSDGNIDVLGDRLGESDWRELRLKIGLVSSSVRQMIPDGEPAQVTVVSGKYAMIDYWGPMHADDQQEAADLLDQIEASHLADRPWRVLSQGERQRILIGRALMARPRLLILDEPCAGMDPVAREHFLGFLQRLGELRKAPALVLVTHHVEEIVPAFTHALLLREGRTVAAGPLKTTLSSKLLSEVFGTALRVSSRKGRYALSIPPGTW